MAGKRANGMGSVGRRSDGRWEGRYSIRDADGRLVRRHVYGRTRREVEDRLVELLQDRNLGLVATRRGRGPTVAAYADRWLTTRASGLRPWTARRYAELLRLHVVPTLGHVPLARLDIAAVNDLLAAKRAAGLAPRTVHHVRAVLRTMLNAALREGVVHRNVAALADPPRVPHVERVTLTPDQARELVEAAEAERDGALWIVALATGARQGELLGLSWADYDEATRTLRIRHALHRVEGQLTLVETKTARSRRVVGVPPVAAEALARQRAAQAGDQLRTGPRWANARDLIFTTTLGEPRDGTVVTHKLQLRCRELGLPGLRFHDLRHTAATLLSGAGVQPRDVQAALGHANITTTLAVYTGVTPGGGALVASAMEAILTGTPARSG